MLRKLFVAAAAAALLAVPVEAKRAIVAYTPVQKLARADAVVIGKVSAIEKEPVSAAPHPGAAEKVSYSVAVVKVETGLVGAANTTHVKVGFIPPAPAKPDAPVRPIRGGVAPVDLAADTAGVFYLTKHHSGDFYVINPLLAPTTTGAADYKEQVALAEKGAAVLADPAKALKVEKAADRFFAAVVLVTKYRAYPTNGEAETVKLPADESKLILKALAEGDWANDTNGANGYQTFFQLGLGENDGWKQPQAKPGEDHVAKVREAFAAWVAGPGKNYQINTLVAKKSGK